MGNTSPYLDYRDDSPFPLAPAETGIDLGQMDWAAPPRRDERKSLLETESNVRELARLLTGMRRETITDGNGLAWETPARRAGTGQITTIRQWSLTQVPGTREFTCSVGTVLGGSTLEALPIVSSNQVFTGAPGKWLVLKADPQSDFDTFGSLLRLRLELDTAPWVDYPAMYSCEVPESPFTPIKVNVIRFPLWRFLETASGKNRETLTFDETCLAERIIAPLDMGVVEYQHQHSSGLIASTITLAPDFGGI